MQGGGGASRRRDAASRRREGALCALDDDEGSRCREGLATERDTRNLDDERATVKDAVRTRRRQCGPNRQRRKGPRALEDDPELVLDAVR